MNGAAVLVLWFGFLSSPFGPWWRELPTFPPLLDMPPQADEEKSIPGNQVVAIRQIIQQRNTSGKGTHTARSAIK